MTQRPIVAVTMGDPAGIGPEVAAKALAQHDLAACCRPVLVGDAAVLQHALQLVGSDLALDIIADVRAARFQPGACATLDLQYVELAALEPGKISADSGLASSAYVKLATELAIEREVDAIATGPINKAAWSEAGIPHIGHTEILATLTGRDAPASRVTTMLATPQLRVVHVTRHVPLGEVAALITRDRVLDTIRTTHQGLIQMGIPEPRLAVAAVNPHGGDGGLVGREEIEEIAPAVQAARRAGI
ncbi:MAG: 4-hydroxythreonine-4-phosphate dehydrogenase PdxA, partial [Anaerolineae bacterium]